MNFPRVCGDDPAPPVWKEAALCFSLRMQGRRGEIECSGRILCFSMYVCRAVQGKKSSRNKNSVFMRIRNFSIAIVKITCSENIKSLVWKNISAG